MSDLMISVAGIRGIIGDNVTPDLFSKFVSAFGSFRGGTKAKIILGRDTRISGGMLRHAVSAGLVAVGCEVIDIGVCATPTVGIQIRKQKAQGGVMLSASHNPIQWNALKLIWEDGIFMDAENGEKFLKLFHENKINYADVHHLGKVLSHAIALEEHQELILSHINQEAIKKRKFKIVYDPCNGAGALIILPLLKKLGCSVTTINENPNGQFAHNPEPVPENLKELGEAVKTFQADLGIATDPDVDRVAFVSEEGEPVGEENGLALVVDYVLKQQREGQNKKSSSEKPVVVVNMSTTRAIDDVAEKRSAVVFRTRIGEAYVARRMMAEPNCIIGGEGNGGVIYPPTHYGRDAAIGVGLLLESLAQSEKSLSHLAGELTSYIIVKDKIELEQKDIPKLLERLQKEYSSEKIDTLDGVKVNFKDSWVHVRPSGTEPIVRIIAEAKSADSAKSLCSAVKSLL